MLRVTTLKKAFLFSILCGIVCSSAISQILVSGQVKGQSSKEFKKSPVLLSEARISFVAEGESNSVLSNLVGLFEISLKQNKRYLVTVSRENYNAKSIWINTHNLPKTTKNQSIVLKDLNFILLKSEAFPQDISLKEDMGQLAYNRNQNTFALNRNKDFVLERIKNDNSLILLEKTITVLELEDQIQNKDQKENRDEQQEVNQEENQSNNQNKKTNDKSEVVVEQLISTIDLSEMDTEEEILKQRQALDSAKQNLELLKSQVKTKEDSLYVGKLEAQLKSLEIALNSAERTIESQKTIIAYQKKLITIYIISAILLLVIVLVGIWFYREKVRMNHLLEEKNQLIMDGITYANTIQSSFLKSSEDIQKILPDFTLFFRPRDIVSGDIYWVGSVNSNVVVAAIDCTGHGVPGAFISMIANTLLNEIVNNKKQLDPGIILNELHLGVMEVLQQDAGGSQSQDGMDMSLVVINSGNREMKFAGARNHMVRVKGKELETIKADINSIGGRSLRSADGFSKTFTTKKVELDRDSRYFLFSDGYIDQFGGPENRKFNLPNFHELLKECSVLPKEDQERKLTAVFDSWKGKEEQLDDVLVLSFKV